MAINMRSNVLHDGRRNIKLAYYIVNIQLLATNARATVKHHLLLYENWLQFPTNEIEHFIFFSSENFKHKTRS